MSERATRTVPRRPPGGARLNRLQRSALRTLAELGDGDLIGDGFTPRQVGADYDVLESLERLGFVARSSSSTWRLPATGLAAAVFRITDAGTAAALELRGKP